MMMMPHCSVLRSVLYGHCAQARRPSPSNLAHAPAGASSNTTKTRRKAEFAQLLRESAPLEAGDTISYRSKALPSRLFQRLKRGQFSVQDELDLHGATVVQAETLLRQFLLEAHTYEYGCVRIIHGKGLQSNGGTPVLKNLVNQLLRLRKDVLAFHSSPPAQGGTGAVLVLLTHR